MQQIQAPRLLAILFVLLIILPVTDYFTNWLGPVRNTENRKLVELPTWENLKYYSPSDISLVFETYLKEQFRGRSQLFDLYVGLNRDLLGVSPLDAVILGQEDWLFLGNGTYYMALEDYMGVKPLHKVELDLLYQQVHALQEKLAERGIAYYLFIMPNKHSIYGELLPERLQRMAMPHNRRLNQVDTLLADFKPYHNFTDTLKYYKEHAVKQPIYLKTDSHWNDLGAYYAYRAMMQIIGKDFPSLEPAVPLQHFTLHDSLLAGGDIARLMALDTKLRERAPVMSLPKDAECPLCEEAISTETEDANDIYLYNARKPSLASAPKILFFRDSFASALWPFIRLNFAETTMIWEFKIEEKFLELYQPDIIVHFIVERHIHNLLGGMNSPETREVLGLPPY